MSTASTFANAGTEKQKIDVRLSYRIVRLFSEGLYASPNKAIEELVANSFDAGATQVAVFLPSDFHDQGATIGVLDNGEGMDAAGLTQHWLIGKSLKRELEKQRLPKGRAQIGKFGIGKLSTYVLCNRLTHISKRGDKFYSTSMNYRDVDERGEEEVEPKAPIRIPLHELTEAQSREALKPWTDLPAFVATGLTLFGKGAQKTWTFAILSDLKPKVHEIQRPKLAWVLRTALPLRDDFGIHLDGSKLESSKHSKGRLRRWTLGKDMAELPHPAGGEIKASEDKNQPEDAATRFGFDHPRLGRVTGYAEAYKELLTGKSDGVGRSHGFFVYVLGRLINVDDGHFGISPDELRHGTFGRTRVVVNMDGLDAHLQSDRERIRHGPVFADAQNVLKAIFNVLRTYLAKADTEEDPAAKLVRSLAGSSSSVSRRPIVEIARAALEGKFTSRYVAVPPSTTPGEREALVADLEKRIETPETFVAAVEFFWDVDAHLGIAVYDAKTGVLRINGFHPFIGAFFEEFESRAAGLPLKLFAMAEVLLEAQLHQEGYKQADVDAVMSARDQYLRDVAQGSGRRTALTVSRALHDARNDEDRLEEEMVAAFTSLGFDAVRDGRNGKADGVATAHLGPDEKGVPRRYSITLEAKSKATDGKPVSAATVNVAIIAQHRDEYECEHAIVVGPSFATTKGDEASITKLIEKDRELTKGNGRPKTITLIQVDDLARLVRLAPVKGLSLSKLRGLFQSRLPSECKAWIDGIEKSHPKRPPYKEIIEAIHHLQQKYHKAPVEYGSLRVLLGVRTPPIDYATDQDLIDLCKAMSQMAAGYITATSSSVELDQSPANVINAIESATKAHLADNH